MILRSRVTSVIGFGNTKQDVTLIDQIDGNVRVFIKVSCNSIKMRDIFLINAGAGHQTRPAGSLD